MNRIIKRLSSYVWLWTVTLVTVSLASDQVEELPPPRSSTTADAEPSTNLQSENVAQGWALKGERGQHLFFGDLAIADYTWEGRRVIIGIDQDPTEETEADPNFLYFHERETGNRWALGRYSNAARTHAVYFQSANGPKEWTRLHDARLSQTNDRSTVLRSVLSTRVLSEAPIVIEPALPSSTLEQTCGREWAR